KKENISWLGDLVPQIENLGCKDVTIIFYEELKEKDFFYIFEIFEDTRIKSFEITSKYHKKITDKLLFKINSKLQQLTRLTFFSAPEDKTEFWDDKIFYDRIYSTNKIASFKSCGIVDKKYFNVNLPKVIEAINYNSCLNMKMAVDINGNIKNCPAMIHNFGNVKDTKLGEALNDIKFKQYWNISKDQIEGCKDCEFRYICTDCRAYIEDPKNLYSKPLKCGYNPYTTTWEEWSINPLKDKAIEFYGMTKIEKNNA